MSKYITEFIGTFFLVLTVGCTVMGHVTGVIPPLAIGAILMTMIYAGGHISGGHYNPAVTLGVWIRGRCPTSDVAPYIVAQIGGSVIAALAAKYLYAKETVTPSAVPLVPVLLTEFLFTFALVYVVLNVATAKANAGNSHYGLAIGFTVLAGAFSVGSISGAAFNPAVAVGACTMGIMSWSSIWIYLVANLAGGAVAGAVCCALNPQDP